MSLHPLLKQQFDDARQASGQLDLRKLLQSDQRSLRRVGRRAARRRALDEAAGRRDQRLHPRGARKRRRAAAGRSSTTSRTRSSPWTRTAASKP
ncbi:MAG: hypothetical protein MZV65_53660 [Chromatiales bacterium]|nr:hypothetical protein [Chromatiales bacterium]